MFDFALSELLLVGVVALVVLGPERLPHAARMAGKMIGKLQGLVSNVKQELSAQAELDELRKAKQEFESAANRFRNEMKDAGHQAQSNLNEISDGLKPWERLPEQRTPADFGLDPQGRPLPAEDMPSENAIRYDDNGQPIAPPGANTASDDDDAWQAYLSGASVVQATAVSEEIIAAPEPKIMHIDSLHKQAMQRKRDMRPKFRPKPQLRVRKK